MKNLLSIQLLGAGLALLFTNACSTPSDDVGAEAGDGDGDAAETGDGDPASGDGDGEPGDGDGEPGDGDGEPGDALEQACIAACSVFELCEDGREEPSAGCIAGCIESSLALEDQECVDAETNFIVCLGGLTCEEFDEYLDEDPLPYPCQVEEELLCGGPEELCFIDITQGDAAGECGVEAECPLDVYAMACDGQTCVCTENGVEVGGCADAVDVCESPELALEACCGFEPE